MWEYWTLGVRCMLVVVFAVSAVSKVRRRTAYAEFVASLRALGDPVSRRPGPVAAGIVLAEAAIVALTVVPATAALGLAAAAGVLAVFAAGIELTVRRGRTVACRCFGSATVPLGRIHVIRNLMLAGLAASGPAVGPPTGGHLTGFALAAFAAVIGAVVLIRLDEIVDLFVTQPRPRSADRG